MRPATVPIRSRLILSTAFSQHASPSSVIKVKVLFVVSGVTILLSLTVFHNIVTETLPQVSDAMPLLGTYQSASMSALPSLPLSFLPSISVVTVTCPTITVNE